MPRERVMTNIKHCNKFCRTSHPTAGSPDGVPRKNSRNIELASIIQGHEAPFTGMFTSGVEFLKEKNRRVVSPVPTCSVDLAYDARIIIVDLQAAALLQSFVDGLQHLPVPSPQTVAGRGWVPISVKIRNEFSADKGEPFHPVARRITQVLIRVSVIFSRFYFLNVWCRIPVHVVVCTP